MIVMSQSTVCSLRLKKRKGDSNPKGTAVRAPALQDAILHQVCGYIAPPRPGPDPTALPMEVIPAREHSYAGTVSPPPSKGLGVAF